MQLNRRLTKGLQFESSYTLSKATDNGQSSSIFPGNNYPSNPFDLSADQGPSDFDARHKFTATAVWSSASRWSNHGLARAILNGLTTSMVFFAKSGAPYSAGVLRDSRTAVCERASTEAEGPVSVVFHCSPATRSGCRAS